jgi:hypothetical protein
MGLLLWWGGWGSNPRPMDHASTESGFLRLLEFPSWQFGSLGSPAAVVRLRVVYGGPGPVRPLMGVASHV